MKTSYTLAELESAINYWRTRSPSAGDELSLCPEASALAEPYALMIFSAQREVDTNTLGAAAQNALAVWHEQQAS
ncbi:DUF3717 domain-containing protein [Paralcaligenes sp. KSB-10]|jgi:hypothetical protein|uniref:DUF3717 domain-containing protein n=1 Tax=Paralcaligenes sp. KSB-10 TaxID=2901142 RepID=UPI001E4D96A6|nr:DUF3717 domain-containing protein [Paralcaligenes sp. KSB-10]UHL63797.1 DUF3717 domain-containing protein [Paralcaligenes sp. KSB-10]